MKTKLILATFLGTMGLPHVAVQNALKTTFTLPARTSEETSWPKPPSSVNAWHTGHW